MYYDRLRQRVREVNAQKRRQREALAVLDTLDVKDHIASVYLPLHADIEAQAHTVYNLPGGRGSCKSSFVSLEIVNGVMKDPTGDSSAIVFRLVAGTMMTGRASLIKSPGLLIPWASTTYGKAAFPL